MGNMLHFTLVFVVAATALRSSEALSLRWADILSDPEKPMSGWRSAWRKLTKAIECPACGKLQDPGKTCCDERCNADQAK